MTAALCLAAAPILAPAQALDAAYARAVLASCAAEASPDLKGLDAFSQECPDLALALHDLGLDAQLPSHWETKITPRALSNWSALAVRYTGDRPQIPDAARLREIAQHLPPPQSRPSLWDRVTAWGRSWLQAHRGWWSQWRRYLSGWTAPHQLDALVYGLLALVLLSAAFLVNRELRAAGFFSGGRRGGPAPRGSPALPAPAQEAPAFLDLAALPPHLRPVLLLRALVAQLARSQRIGNARDLTCRELVTSARFDTGGQRERFAALALLAEARLYGPLPPSTPLSTQQDAVLAEAQALAGPLGLPAGRRQEAG